MPDLSRPSRTPSSAADHAAPRESRDRRNRRVILVVGGIIVLLMTYGSGMRAQVKRIRDIDEKRKAVMQDLRQEQRTSRLRLGAAEQLEARRQVALAVSELDRRNFGTAQTHVAEAARLLALVQKADTANPDLSAAQTALSHTNLVAAADIAVQRDALAVLAAQMDKAFDGYTPPFLQTSEANDDAHPIQKPTMNDVPNLTNAHEMSQAD